MQDTKLHKGPWLEEEDELLVTAVAILGERKWDALAKTSGLRRSGKSCRLRWVNYLHPNLKRDRLTEEEERVIIQLHEKWGNKWSRIAQSLPGRTDNEIKNFWRRRLSRKTSLVEQKVNTSDKNPSTAKCGEVSPLSRNDECASHKGEIFGSSTDTSIGQELWSEQAHSPYEMRLSEWISNLSPEQSVMQTFGDLWNFDNI